MKNFKTAKELAAERLGTLAKIYLIQLLITFGVVFVSIFLLPLLPLTIVGLLLYTMISTYYFYNKMVLGDEEFSFDEIVKLPFKILMDKLGLYLKFYLVYFLKGVGVGFLLFVLLFVIVLVATLSIKYELILLSFLTIPLIFVFIFAILYFILKLVFELKYKISATVLGVDYKECALNNKKEIKKLTRWAILMTIVLSLIPIPILNSLLVIYANMCYDLKIILDAKGQNETVTEELSNNISGNGEIILDDEKPLFEF